jgi:hypothetical protein
MQNFLTARRRRYAVAFVVAAASLGVLGACNPTKPTPPPPPPASPCSGGPGACLSTSPVQWVFHTFRETKIFTVKNDGPDTSQPLRVAIFGGNISEDRLRLEWTLVQTNDFCPGKSLVPGDTCTVGVQSTHIADNTTSETFLNVSSDNSQPGGWAAPLIAGCDANLMPCP